MLVIKEISFLILILFSTVINCDVKGKLIIDNDAGADDAIAILMALLYEKHFDGPEVIGLTTANGNTNEDNVSINNQRILKIANRQDIPIYRGAKAALITAPSTNAYYGEDGLGNTIDEEGEREGLSPVHNMTAVEALIQLSKKYENELTLVTIGTLTNVALALRLDNNFIGRLKHLYIGAGHVHDEHLNAPEFNALMDVEAYHITVEHVNPDKVTVFPFSTTKYTLNLTQDWRQNVFGAIDTDIVRAINRYERVAMKKSHLWQSLDPSVIAVVLNPDLVKEYKYSKNDIILSGEKRGITTHEMVENKSEANVRLVHHVKIEEYKQFLLDVFSKE
ncbi:inosine-uridine preferring nucleoside hydrolase domain-containing protein [Phthorimaea operculella]|nr:inosine-uridine preferring nucleoside hydrolase domain-containing protein [Phthorimaea operculella]